MKGYLNSLSHITIASIYFVLSIDILRWNQDALAKYEVLGQQHHEVLITHSKKLQK
jgi:hypothetical protein